MRLYHSHFLMFAALLLLVVGCSGPQAAAQGLIRVSIAADGQTRQIQIPAGSTVQQALDYSHLSLGQLDELEPASFAVLTDGNQVRIVRVIEKFAVKQEIVPFEQQRLPTELLPEGEKRLDPLQPGEAGLQEITERIVYKDGIEVSRIPIKTVTVKEAQPQIMLVGVKSLFTPVSIPGRLVYLVGGNAWMMEQTTGNRRPLITSGDLDGHILSLSPDASWLLFTRRSNEKNLINTLWVAKIDSDPVELIDLKIKNVVHFADWVPGSSNRVAYSTAEPQSGAPGWKSNNDLNYLTIYKSGAGSFIKVDIKESIGGFYDWWGVNLDWSPDGQRLAYSNSSEVGLLGITREETPQMLLGFNPYQTHSDWAWTPGITWGSDGHLLYIVSHPSQAGAASPDESPQFDLTALPLQGGPSVPLVSNVGMFAYPAASPLQSLPSGNTDYQIAFLQAIFPEQSETSRYRLMVVDRDGSNRRELFPAQGEMGLDPQPVVWSPEPLGDGKGYAIAVIYRNNLWLVDSSSGSAQQITGDEMVSRIVWKRK